MKTPFQKTYPGEAHRPSVELEVFEKENVLIASTPWGSRDSSKQATQMIREYYGTAMTDPEATSPFARLPGLSTSANSLRAATFLANETIFQKYNKDNYTSGCELLILTFNNRELSWVQIGQPHLLLLRGGKFIPLQVALDLNLDYLSSSPLPGKLLGVDRQIELETKSFILQKNDLIVLLARSQIPAVFLSSTFNKPQASDLGQKLFELAVKDDPQMPFWISVFQNS